MPISQRPPPRPRREFHECWYRILSVLGLHAEPQKVQKYQFLSMGPWEHQERRGITRLDTGAPKVHFLVKMTKMSMVGPRVNQRSNEVQTPAKQHFSQFYFKLEILEDFKLLWLVWPKFNPGWAPKTLILIQPLERVETNVIVKIINLSFQRLFMGRNRS